MVDRPIIFSAIMISALLAGQKTQTRRLAWGPMTSRHVGGQTFDGGATITARVRLPRPQVVAATVEDA